jgi:anti-sigma factor RsiW
MTCDAFLELVSDVIDGALTPAQRAEADAHLASCEACAQVVADLRRIQQATGSIERLAAPAGTWKRIEAHLLADAGFAAAHATHRQGRATSWRSHVWLAAAAVLVLAIGSALYVAYSRAPETTMGGSAAVGANPGNVTNGANASQTALVESVEMELQLAADHYEKAIAALELVASQSDNTLDPAVTATLRGNLQIIDQAINDSRVALRVQPDDSVAQESLFEAFRRKVALLQDTIALMNEMRKGDTAGAARVVESLNKS